MEYLKNALSILINITEKIDSAMEDDHISISEGVGITLSAIGLIKVVKNFPKIKEEFIELNDVQKKQLSKWFADEFQLDEKKAEKIIEEVFQALLGLSEVIGHIKAAA